MAWSCECAQKAAFKIEVLPAGGKNFSLAGTREDKHRDDVSEHHLGNLLEPVDFHGGLPNTSTSRRPISWTGLASRS